MGIEEAIINEVKRISLEEGHAEGHVQGHEIGKEEALITVVKRGWEKGLALSDIAELTNIPLRKVEEITLKLTNKLTIDRLLGSADDFLSKIFDRLHNDQIDVSTFDLDHICYRVTSIEKYHNLKKELLFYGQFLIESQIGGRAISTFKLFEPIQFGNRNIWLLELPAPKTGSIYSEGFEHVEFVIDTDLETFIKNHPNINFDLKGLTKEVNADVRIKYKKGSVKFHTHSLENIIEKEQKAL